MRLIPRAGRSEVGPERSGVLVVRVTAPPVEGKANAALRRLLAKRLGVPLGSVTIVRGEIAREKLVRIEGIDEQEMRAALGLP